MVHFEISNQSYQSNYHFRVKSNCNVGCFTGSLFENQSIHKINKTIFTLVKKELKVIMTDYVQRAGDKPTTTFSRKTVLVSYLQVHPLVMVCLLPSCCLHFLVV